MTIDELLKETTPRPMSVDTDAVVHGGRRRQRRARAAAVLVGAGATALVTVAALTVSGQLDGRTATVPGVAVQGTSQSVRLPLPSTAPVGVVEVYVAAAESVNCSLTAELTLDHTWPWCDDPALLDARNIRAIGGLQTPGPGAPPVQAVTLEINTRGSSDGTIPAGWTPWTFLMSHETDGWRIYDQGPA